jgi:hypothetical protein
VAAASKKEPGIGAELEGFCGKAVVARVH